MNKEQHAALLARAMGEQGITRPTIADAVGRGARTVTNWTTGGTMPDEEDRATLRRLLGDYDRPGDGVERAVRSSELHEWRQDAVVSFYKRNLHEQRAEASA